MKTIILILLVVGLIGCSQYNIFSKKPQEVHQEAHMVTNKMSKHVSKEGEMKTAHMSTSIPFKPTLSSLMPMMDSKEDMDMEMSWQQMSKDFFLSSNIIFYIFFAISFIVIVRLIYMGTKNKTKLKAKMS